jgi:hypothetical protein
MVTRLEGCQLPANDCRGPISLHNLYQFIAADCRAEISIEL